jgi:hypothetical protein
MPESPIQKLVLIQKLLRKRKQSLSLNIGQPDKTPEVAMTVKNFDIRF